jgi:hypothetical protein
MNNSTFNIKYLKLSIVGIERFVKWYKEFYEKGK